MPVNLGETKNNKFYLFFSPRRRGSSVVCDNGRFISAKVVYLPSGEFRTNERKFVQMSE